MFTFKNCRLVAVLAEITRTNDYKMLLQILNYDQKSWIQEQTLGSCETLKLNVFFNFHGRLFFTSFEFGSFTLDEKSLTFVPFPEWISKTFLSNSTKLYIMPFIRTLNKE